MMAKKLYDGAYSEHKILPNSNIMNPCSIITSGRKYIDIDAYASMIAYRELLRVQGHKNIAASTTGELNYSIPPIILGLKYKLDLVKETGHTKYIVLDVSNPDFFDKRVNMKNLIEVIDHHTGFEKYWANYPKVETQIEYIGSVCTLIYERIVESECIEILDTDICKLLVAGILDNTLNLKSSITTDRDRIAYREMLRIGKIPHDYYMEYFNACEAEIVNDFATAIRNDLKIEKVGILPEAIGQMVVLDIDKFNHPKAQEIFAEFPEWLMNVICLEDGKSYLYFGGNDVGRRLEQIFDAKIQGSNLLVLDNFLLRKQIIKRARDMENKLLKESK